MKTAPHTKKKIDISLLVVQTLCIVLFWLLAHSLMSIVHGPGLTKAVSARLNESGVASPVTAVLLNFRGYDTLLEIMVLFLAVLGAWSIVKAYLPPELTNISPIQAGAVRLLVPLMALVAFYLIWQGSRFAGGAFQGGSILGGIGVLLLVNDRTLVHRIKILPIRIGLVFGPLIFLVVALSCIRNDKTLLTYPPNLAGFLLLLIELACGVSIGLTLGSLFAGGRPGHEIKNTPKDRKND